MTDGRTVRARRTGTSSILKERARTQEASRRGGNVSGPLITVGGSDLGVRGWG